MQLNILDIICQRLNTHVRVDSWQVHLCVEKYLYQLNVCIHSDLHVCTFIFFQILVTLNIILVLSMRLLLSHLLVCQQGEKHTWLKNWVVISTGLASRLKVTMQLVIYDTFQLTYDYMYILSYQSKVVDISSYCYCRSWERSCTHVRVCVCVWGGVCMYVCVCLCTCAYMHDIVCIRVHGCACMCVCVYVLPLLS